MPSHQGAQDLSAAKRAIFLDRDGTLVRDYRHGGDPAALRLLPGVLEAARAWRDAGYLLVVVTNQSAVARGLITGAEARRTGSWVAALMARGGAPLAAYLLAPTHPEGRVLGLGIDAPPDLAERRKPGAGMLRDAASRLDIDLARSWLVGDSRGDVGAARSAGVRPILLDIGALSLSADEVASGAWDDVVIARSLPHAAALSLGVGVGLAGADMDADEAQAVGEAQSPGAYGEVVWPPSLAPATLIRSLREDGRRAGEPSPWPNARRLVQAARDGRDLALGRSPNRDSAPAPGGM